MLDEDGRWMTFPELAEARGTSRHAAEVLVRRHKWRKQDGNDGRVRVLVPPGFDRPVSHFGALFEGEKSDKELVAAFRTSIDRLTSAYAEAKALLQRDLDRLTKGMTEQIEAQMRHHSTEMQRIKEVAAKAEAELKQAQDEAQALQQRLDEMEVAKKGRGLWERLRAAWRGTE